MAVAVDAGVRAVRVIEEVGVCEIWGGIMGPPLQPAREKTDTQKTEITSRFFIDASMNLQKHGPIFLFRFF